MSKHVFILGAGASADGGAPVLKNFLTKARSLRDSLSDSGIKNSFVRVFEGIRWLQQTQAKAEIDLNNLEHVYSLFEMAKALDFSSIPNVETLTQDLKKVIVYTLEKSTKFGIDQSGKVLGPRQYLQFAQILRKRLEENENGEEFGFITFNYDVGLESALMANGFAIDYQFTNTKRPGSLARTVKVLKLHGSTNWFQEYPRAPINLANIYDKIGFADDQPNQGMNFDTVAWHSEMGDRRFEPVIVPPSWDKGSEQILVAPIWREASEMLGSAELIHIIGYSMPDTDQAFPSLLALSGALSEPLIRVTAANYNDGSSRVMRHLGGEAKKVFREVNGRFLEVFDPQHFSRHIYFPEF